MLIAACSFALFPVRLSTANEWNQTPPESFVRFGESFCIDCHSGPDAEARIDLSAMGRHPLQTHLSDWRKIQRVLREGSMPPDDAEHPTESQRQEAIAAVDESLSALFRQAASDPGPSLIRRLTNAEYQYSIEDLTGVELDVASQLASDGVGGSGFTNSGSAQFMQDAALSRYLEAAKMVADHAVIGAGPIYFSSDPGQTGQEMSAIGRLQYLYRQHGFRSSAGEGAKPFGLDRFPKAFHVAWQFRHRDELGMQEVSLESLARQMNLEPKFARHIWSVLNRSEAAYPLSVVIDDWNKLPSPSDLSNPSPADSVAHRCEAIFENVQRLQSLYASSASDEEEAALLYDHNIEVPAAADFDARAVRKFKRLDDNFTPDLNNPDLYSEDGTIRWKLSVDQASHGAGNQTRVVFSNPEIQFRVVEVVQPDPVPLRPLLSDEVVRNLRFGVNPNGEPITGSEFVVGVGESKVIEAVLPDHCRSAELTVHARLDRLSRMDAVVRCTIEDITSDRGRQYSTLLRDPDSEAINLWEVGLGEFAAALPQISHREPAPSDRDPIPAPFDNTYNVPERNYFHTAIKYHRSDEFLVEKVADDDVVSMIDVAWTDLLTSFDYHDVNLRFVSRKFGVELGGRTIETIDEGWMSTVPEAASQFIRDYKAEFDRMNAALRAAESGHVKQMLHLAARAWRRPLTDLEAERLRTFYQSNRQQREMSHAESIRACITRILVSPNFVYRIENAPPAGEADELDGLELAARLSFALWSSLPDDELVSTGTNGQLTDDEVLQKQVNRMLKSEKSRRLATEFFGQWLGFYQFDQYRGIDATRFPEFDDDLKTSLYDEAISFFEWIIRHDRPYTEILSADYTIANQRVAQHYGIRWVEESESDASPILTGGNRVIRAPNRGGVFGLGAILSATSAPLRTSPVKRGDWILRRLVGTPVPPPPADAGSIPAEEVLADGMTVRERLEIHRDRAECMGCHVRIDPLGFALENFDSLGRWRESYLDQQPIKAEGELADGRIIRGPGGLKQYMREMDLSFRRTFASKLVGYFLGRAETVYDAQLIENIAANLERDPRFSTAVITIVRSPQFRQIRADGAADNRDARVSTGSIR